jgi:CubicO group peptidase (beta-lactamase class C family)
MMPAPAGLAKGFSMNTELIAETPEEVGLDSAKVEALMARAAQEVREGLLPSCQIAIARGGSIGAMRTFARAAHDGAEPAATDRTRYVIFSCTKAIVSAAAWLLIRDGKLEASRRVVDYIPEFGTNGKEVVTVEQLFTHTAGFPDAPYRQEEWQDRAARLRRFGEWRLQWPPGSRYVYHPLASFWVIAELIDRLSGQDYRDFVHERIAVPFGLDALRVGVTEPDQTDIATIEFCGQWLTPRDYAENGWPAPPPELNRELLEAGVLGFNHPFVRAAGAPAAGGIMTAAELALFYQAMIAGGRTVDGTRLWSEAAMRDLLRVRTDGCIDPLWGNSPNRALGVVIAGGDGHARARGFSENHSPLAFGHGGAGGQIGWGDPVSGISLGYCTNGFDRNEIRQSRRSLELSTMAAACAI